MSSKQPTEPSRAPARFIILGGGCYGTFYARQLLRAQSAGALAIREIVIVDHNALPAAAQDPEIAGQVRFERTRWDDFFDQFLDEASPSSPDQFVPSPFNPHLGLGWLMRVLQRDDPAACLTLEESSRLPGTPFQEQREHGTLVASHADWICPVHCIEPEICPKTRDTRYWDMDRTAHELATRLTEAGQRIDQVHLFHCHHVSYGVGAYPAAELVLAHHVLRAALKAPESHVRALVGTISRCHGAFHILAAHTGMDTVSATATTSGRHPHGAGSPG
jgi:hypothetical protein